MTEIHESPLPSFRVLPLPTDFDFHCLRHSYITAVVKSGCSVKVAQELARHANPKLTLNVYSHLTAHDLTEGLDGLSHALPEPAKVTMRKTGTDQTPIATTQDHIKSGQYHACPTPIVSAGLSGTDDTLTISSPGGTQTDHDDMALRAGWP
jgi:hypothetical protein